MITYKEIKEIRKAYRNQKNIMDYLGNDEFKLKRQDIIQYSYDLQAGSYSRVLKKSLNDLRIEQCKKLSRIIKNLNVNSILEAGVGEANTLSNIMSYLSGGKYFGFDISLSRLLYARNNIKKLNEKKAVLFSAELDKIPFEDNSIDLVYTFHSIEPNHGNEEKILEELYRITKKYLILIEPSYELGSKKTKEHINKFNYCKGLPKLIKKKKYNIIKNELYGFSLSNNQTAIIIIEKNKNSKSSKDIQFVSPISNKPVKKHTGFYYCKDDGYIFPIINRIPNFLVNNSILASKLHLFDE